MSASSEVSGNGIGRRSSVQVLSRLASSARWFHSADGRFCTQVPVGDRRAVHEPTRQALEKMAAASNVPITQRLRSSPASIYKGVRVSLAARPCSSPSGFFVNEICGSPGRLPWE